MSTKINLPELKQKRVVIVGGGFAGLELAQSLPSDLFQVVLIDKNNYHQFQPLFYQVAMAGLEPSSIVFPFRKTLQETGKFFRMAEVKEVIPEKKCIMTNLGVVNYDYLVLAMGAKTHYFGNKKLGELTLPMKSVSEAIHLRNRILEDYENALTCVDTNKREGYLNIVIVGGGPTGVELAGALAEMKNHILPKDYPELNLKEIDIYLIEGNPKLLKTMSEKSSNNAHKYLKNLGVDVLLNTHVLDFDGKTVYTKEGHSIITNKVIWAAGVAGNPINGLSPDAISPQERYEVNTLTQVKGYTNIFAIGDIAQMTCEAYPNGHPQVAQVAIQQAKNLSKNLILLEEDKEMEPFAYKDLGSMATIGRHAAVADIGSKHINGPIAWYLWLLVHLKAILGVKNKVVVLFNWVWNYLTYDQSLRLIIRAKNPHQKGANTTGINKKN
jgi:NADH dehydrogenase